jgi:hypothetical protein
MVMTVDGSTGEQGRPDVCNEQRSGRPLTATDEFHKQKVDELIKDNRLIT